MTTRKTIALTRWTFAGKILSLLFNMLSMFVIAFCPRIKCLSTSWLQSPSAVILILETQENKVCHCFHHFSIYLPWSDGTCYHGLSFMNVEFEARFLTFIKRIFSSSSLSSIRVVSSAYLRLLIFLPTILIPACASSSLAFHMVYSPYK